jgi:hypothetical protein
VRDFLKLKLNPTRGTLTSLRKKGPIYPGQGLHFSPCSLSLVDFELLINSLNVSVGLILVSLLLALIECLTVIRILKSQLLVRFGLRNKFSSGDSGKPPFMGISYMEHHVPWSLDAQFTDRAPAYKL